MKRNNGLLTLLIALLLPWQCYGAAPAEGGWLVSNNTTETLSYGCWDDFVVEMGGINNYVPFLRKQLKSIAKNFKDYWRNPYPTLAVDGRDGAEEWAGQPFELLPGETVLLRRRGVGSEHAILGYFSIDVSGRAQDACATIALPLHKATVKNDGSQTLTLIDEHGTKTLPPQQSAVVELTDARLTLTIDGEQQSGAHCIIRGVVPGLQEKAGDGATDEEEAALATRGYLARPYYKPTHVSQEVWEALQPYFLPASHPLRSKLDKLFSQHRVLANSSSVERAGFKNSKPGRFSHVIVSQHRGIDDYIFKFFSDESSRTDWPQLLRRAEGARSLQAAIDRHRWGKLFAVPKKWIYPLPHNAPPAKEGSLQKNFILVCEEMDIYARNQNYSKWKHDISRHKLNALYVLLTEEGLVDSPLAFNIPFCHDGRIAFIDLEHHHRWPIPYHKLTPYLREDMQAYWQQLIDQGGPH